MTSFWLFLSEVFKFSYKFYDLAGNVVNWVLFLAASIMFCYWCYTLITTFGNNKDKDYHSPTEGKYPYYNAELHTEEN